MSRPSQFVTATAAAAESDWLKLLQRQVGSLRYGIVQVVVHDGQVVQIDKTERVRLDERARGATESYQPTLAGTKPNV